MEEALENAQDGPTLVDWNVSRQASEAPVIQEVGVAIPVTQEVGVTTPAVQEGGVAVPVGPDVEMDDLGILEEEEEMEALCIELDASDDEKEEEGFVLRQAQEIEPEIEVAVVKNGGSRKELETETRNDPTLKSWRELAEQGEQGLFWKKNLLFQSKLTHTGEVEDRLVLPKKFQNKVLKMTHDDMQHMGARRVKALITQRFSWPGLGQDVINYIKSCDICQKCNRRGSRKVPMVERRVMAEPFESIAIDLVGPLPTGKGGCRFILTAICMASKWPEAIALKSTTAKAVAIGLMDIFSRTGIPLELLSDQGPQFVGKVITQLCQNLNIDKIKTTPYHPETNGVVERFHGTLKPMLTKAASKKLDWVGQIPFALFALRIEKQGFHHMSWYLDDRLGLH